MNLVGDNECQILFHPANRGGQVIINEENQHDTYDFINKRLSAIKSQRSTGELEDLALIIGTCTVHLRVVLLNILA